MFAQPSNDLAGHKREKAAPGEFKLKLHGVENVQIRSEAHKKKSEVTEKNKHASRGKMEKFVKTRPSKPGRGAGEGLGSGLGTRTRPPGLFPSRVRKAETGPTSISSVPSSDVLPCGKPEGCGKWSELQQKQGLGSGTGGGAGI